VLHVTEQFNDYHQQKMLLCYVATFLYNIIIIIMTIIKLFCMCKIDGVCFSMVNDLMNIDPYRFLFVYSKSVALEWRVN
jgi:hypothetical protein